MLSILYWIYPSYEGKNTTLGSYQQKEKPMSDEVKNRRQTKLQEATEKKSKKKGSKNGEMVRRHAGDNWF